MPIKYTQHFNKNHGEQERHAIMASTDDIFGSCLSLQSSHVDGQGLSMSSRGITSLDNSVPQTVTTPVTNMHSSDHRGFPEAVRGIAYRINGLWATTRMVVGSALNILSKLKGKRNKKREIWTVRISTEYPDPSNGQKIESTSTETDFDCKEEAELFAYQWHTHSFLQKDGYRVTYKATVFMKGSSGDDGEGAMPL